MKDGVNQYQLVGKDGHIYDPVDVGTLKLWAGEGRLTRDMMLIDILSGMHMRAEQMLANLDVFPPETPPVHVPQSAGHQFVAPVNMQVPAPMPGPFLQITPAPIPSRFVALIIDALCSIPLVFLSAIPFVGLVCAPLLCLYWLSRDSFGAQSIGKRVMGLRVVREDGREFTWANSATRNIIYLMFVVMMIPFVGDTLVPFGVGLPGLLDIVLILATQKRLGDHLGHTQVVAAR